MVYAANYLIASGYISNCINTVTESDLNKYYEAIENHDVIVLPMPLTRDNVNVNGTKDLKINDLYSRINDKTVVISSQTPDEAVFESNKFYNYSQNEDFLHDNAYITAEGALGHLLQYSQKTLKASSVLILGWGRIAKYLHKLITIFTSSVSVALRNKQMLRALKDNGIDAYPIEDINRIINRYDIVINTIPSRVLSKDTLINTKSNAYISELASSPGGYDHSLAITLGKSSHVLRGLPGLCAPESAGEVLGKCIISYIENGGTKI